MNVNSPVTPPDLASIVTEIDRQLRGRLRQFKIAHDEQGLVLLGVAGSYYVKQLAQHAVRQMTKLPMRNDIEVH